jgi:hypothetical protein
MAICCACCAQQALLALIKATRSRVLLKHSRYLPIQIATFVRVVMNAQLLQARQRFAYLDGTLLKMQPHVYPAHAGRHVLFLA